MSLVDARREAQSYERLERRAAILIDAFFSASPAAIEGQLDPAFSWFGRAIAPGELDAPRLACLAAHGRFTTTRPRGIPPDLTRALVEREGMDTIVPVGTRVVVLLDLIPPDGGESVTVAVSFAGLDDDARLLAVFDASALVPHLRALG